MNTVELLTAARARIDTPEKWTKGVFRSENRQGRRCFCMVGAIRECTPIESLRYRACCYLEMATMVAPPSAFNDARGTTHADVMAAFDRAIELAKEES